MGGGRGGVGVNRTSLGSDPPGSAELTIGTRRNPSVGADDLFTCVSHVRRRLVSDCGGAAELGGQVHFRGR